MPAQQSTHPGFNNQIAYDPFLASNYSEENLVAVPSEYTPSHHSHFSPTPEPILKSSGAQSVRATSEGLNGHTSQEEYSEGYQSPPSHLNDEEWNNTISSFLSPQDLSDTGYNASSEHTATPEENPFFYDQQLAGLGPANQNFAIDANPHLEKNGSAPTSATSGPSDTRTHRYSTGTATLSSSHLMSPVLTDDQAAPSRNATSSPPVKLNQLKTEPLSSSNFNFIHQVPQYNHFQHTPPMTESSENTSPDMLSSGKNIARAPSPMIRVDQYARGDSPARQDQLFPRPRHRRGGSASSHLSVQATASDEEDDEEEDQRLGRGGGLDPISRRQIGDATVPNFQDQEDDQQLQFKKADVQDWIARNAPVSEAPSDIPPEKPREIGGRRRARSVGAQRLSKANLESLQTTPVDQHIPGPGLLIDEESGEEESSDEEGSEPSIFDEPIASPTPGMNEIPGEARPGVYDELPNQPALYRPKLWQDPLYDSSDPGVKLQPLSSNEAMKRFEERNRDIETVSRVATWGTRRKSDSDMASLFRRFTMMSVKEDEEEAEDTNKQRERSGSIFQRLRPRRNSTLRRKESKKPKESTESKPPLVGSHSRTSSQTSRHDSLSVPKPVSSAVKRMSSLKRPKSPRLDTQSAVAAMANPLAAMGKSGPMASDSPTGAFATAKNVLKRTRSRSELLRNDSKQGSHLADLWNQVGGPPVATLKTEEPDPLGMDDDDDDDDADDPGIKMDLSMRYDPIIPTLDGFRDNIKKLNPRLPRYMIERVAHEQLRRYKKLLDFKVSHVKVVTNRNCPSTKFCMDLNGEPRYFESKAKKEPEVPQSGFSVSGIGPSDEDVNALADGVVTQAQFPNGIPMPPIKRLPAEFECSLCYKVKKLQKPSDWSKHVHEDVQPFTCTFKHCADPKSFKRKADWVRHENERHRQLEWWQCTIGDCNHRCYRKDNFVQHLVREHKLPEPKYKTVKTGKPAVRGPSAQKARKQAEENNYDESDQVWRMVETCKHDTTKSPKDEPCVFCGNICNTWKKLTVHLAKHMEQVSMPVLLIVKDRQVTPDTIISPIENTKITSEATSLSPVDASMDPHSHFPFSSNTNQPLPAGFTSPPTYVDTYQRASPLTYPLPANHQQAYPSYSHPGHGNSNPFPDPNSHHYNPQSFPPTSSPDDLYNLPATSQPYSYVQNTDAYTASPPEQAALYNNPFAGGPATTSSMGTRAPQPTSYPQPTNGGAGQMYGQGGLGAGQGAYPQPANGQGMSYHVDHPMQGYGGGSEEGAGGGYVQPSGPQGFGYQ